MTERRGDSGYSVTTQRVGDDAEGRGGGRRNLMAVLVVAVAVAIVGISVVSERLAERPSLDLSFLPTPTPPPTPPPSPRPAATPQASDLPRLTRSGEVRPGHLPFYAERFRLLDLATGDVADGPPVMFGRDLVIADPDGAGWVCVCGEDAVNVGLLWSVRMIAIEPNGADWQPVGERLQLPDAVTMTQVSNDIDLTADRRHGLYAFTRGVGVSREISIAPFDVAERTFGSLVTLPDPFPSDAPAPSPSAAASPGETDPPPIDPENVSFDGPHIRISPDGRAAIVWDLAQAHDQSGEPVITRFRAWRLDLGVDGSVTASAPAPWLADLPIYCQHVAFIANDRLVWSCPVFTNDRSGRPATSVAVMDLDGRTVAAMEIPGEDAGYGFDPIVDRANGVLYLWSSFGLTMTRLDLATLSAESVAIDPAAQFSTGLPAAPPGVAPEWAATGSALMLNAFRPAAASLDSSQFNVIGFKQNETPENFGPISLGVFVLDRSTLAIVDRWAPAATYYSMTALPDGRSVAFSGAPGVDQNGRSVPWEGSVTIHDAGDGRVVAQYGRLGNQLMPILIGP